MKCTPGPWEWWKHADGEVYLATPDRGRLIVMGFARKGMNGAQPRFAEWDGEERGRLGGLMQNADKLDLEAHPDARLIAAAPSLLQALKDLLQMVETDQLIPESVSYMREARAAVAKVEGALGAAKEEKSGGGTARES